MNAIRGFAVASVVACATLSGCGKAGPADPAEATMVYVDTRSLETFQLPASSQVPASNPSTGKRTLMPGLFCSQCDKWYPAPPLDVLQRSPKARQCPKCHSEMSSRKPEAK